jgi:hypothetical protein
VHHEPRQHVRQHHRKRSTAPRTPEPIRAEKTTPPNDTAAFAFGVAEQQAVAHDRSGAPAMRARTQPRRPQCLVQLGLVRCESRRGVHPSHAARPEQATPGEIAAADRRPRRDEWLAENEGDLR